MRDDGVVSGSVSGGCVEDDLIARTKARFQQAAGIEPSLGKPAMIAHGVSQEEAARFGLPCGGSLRLGGKTVLQHTLDAVQASGLPWHLEDAGHPGMGDSIAAAVQATWPSTGWLILPADLPLVQSDTLRAVAAALAHHVMVVVPVYRGQRGHPVGFSARCGQALLGLNGHRGSAGVVS